MTSGVCGGGGSYDKRQIGEISLQKACRVGNEVPNITRHPQAFRKTKFREWAQVWDMGLDSDALSMSSLTALKAFVSAWIT
jgi:hypothetical protein